MATDVALFQYTDLTITISMRKENIHHDQSLAVFMNKKQKQNSFSCVTYMMYSIMHNNTSGRTYQHMGLTMTFPNFPNVEAK